MLTAHGRRLCLSRALSVRGSYSARIFADSVGDRVKELKSNEDFTKALEQSAGKAMAPIYAALSNKYTKVHFFKADIDDDALLDSVTAQDVQAVPTFTFHKGGKKLAAVAGADPTQLRQLLEEHQ